MNKEQAGNALTLADLLKKKYAQWDIKDLRHCALGIAKQNCELFGSYKNRLHNDCDLFGSRIFNLFFGNDVFEDLKFKSITQSMFRKAILKVVDQEGWEEA